MKKTKLYIQTKNLPYSGYTDLEFYLVFFINAPCRRLYFSIARGMSNSTDPYLHRTILHLDTKRSDMSGWRLCYAPEMNVRRRNRT